MSQKWFRNGPLFFLSLSLRTTLSRVLSGATWSRSTSCAPSVTPRCPRRRLWFANKYKQWRAARWGRPRRRRSSCMKGRRRASWTETRGSWRGPGRGLAGSARDVYIRLIDQRHSCGLIFRQSEVDKSALTPGTSDVLPLISFFFCIINVLVGLYGIMVCFSVCLFFLNRFADFKEFAV